MEGLGGHEIGIASRNADSRDEGSPIKKCFAPFVDVAMQHLLLRRDERVKPTPRRAAAQPALYGLRDSNRPQHIPVMLPSLNWFAGFQINYFYNYGRNLDVDTAICI